MLGSTPGNDILGSKSDTSANGSSAPNVYCEFRQKQRSARITSTSISRPKHELDQDATSLMKDGGSLHCSIEECKKELQKRLTAARGVYEKRFALLNIGAVIDVDLYRDGNWQRAIVERRQNTEPASVSLSLFKRKEPVTIDHVIPQLPNASNPLIRILRYKCPDTTESLSTNFVPAVSDVDRKPIDRRALLDILDDIVKVDLDIVGGVFSPPVDENFQDCMGRTYGDIVQQPMCLDSMRTIAHNRHTSRLPMYLTIAPFRRDLQLIIDNCRLFWKENKRMGPVFLGLAKTFENKAFQILERRLVECGYYSEPSASHPAAEDGTETADYATDHTATKTAVAETASAGENVANMQGEDVNASSKARENCKISSSSSSPLVSSSSCISSMPAINLVEMCRSLSSNCTTDKVNLNRHLDEVEQIYEGYKEFNCLISMTSPSSLKDYNIHYFNGGGWGTSLPTKWPLEDSDAYAICEQSIKANLNFVLRRAKDLQRVMRGSASQSPDQATIYDIDVTDLSGCIEAVVRLLRDMPSSDAYWEHVAQQDVNSELMDFCIQMTRPPHSAASRSFAFEAISYLLPASDWLAHPVDAFIIDYNECGNSERGWIDRCNCFGDTASAQMRNLTKSILFGCKQFQPDKVRIWATRCLAHFCGFSAMGVWEHIDSVNGPLTYLLKSAQSVGSALEHKEIQAAALYGLASMVISLDNHYIDYLKFALKESHVYKSLCKMVGRGMRDIFLKALQTCIQAPVKAQEKPLPQEELPFCVQKQCIQAYQRLSKYESPKAWGYDALSIRDKESIPKSFICGISHEPMRDPVLTCDGLTYDRKCITKWFNAGRDTSPLTNQKLDSRDLIPNVALRQCMDDWIDTKLGAGSHAGRNVKLYIDSILNATSFDKLLASVNKLREFVVVNRHPHMSGVVSSQIKELLPIDRAFGPVVSQNQIQRIANICSATLNSLEQEKSRRDNRQELVNTPQSNLKFVSSCANSTEENMLRANSSTSCCPVSASQGESAPVIERESVPLSLANGRSVLHEHSLSNVFALNKRKLDDAIEVLINEVAESLTDTYVQIGALEILETVRSEAVAEIAIEIGLCERLRDKAKESWAAFMDDTYGASCEKDAADPRHLDLYCKQISLESTLRDACLRLKECEANREKLINLKICILKELSSRKKLLGMLGEQPAAHTSAVNLAVADMMESEGSEESEEEEEEGEAGKNRVNIENRQEHTQEREEKARELVRIAFRKRKRPRSPVQSSVQAHTNDDDNDRIDGDLASESIQLHCQKKRRISLVETAPVMSSHSSVIVDRAESQRSTDIHNKRLLGKWLFEEGHSYYWGINVHKVNQMLGRLMIVTARRLGYRPARAMCLHYGWSNEVRNITPNYDKSRRILCQLQLKKGYDFKIVLLPASIWKKNKEKQSQNCEPLIISCAHDKV